MIRSSTLSKTSAAYKNSVCPEAPAVVVVVFNSSVALLYKGTVIVLHQRVFAIIIIIITSLLSGPGQRKYGKYDENDEVKFPTHHQLQFQSQS
jgi:hypothetical protein